MAPTRSTDTIQAVGVSKYGSLENLESRRLPKPPLPTGRQMLVGVKAAAVNPIDIKVRGGVYDDAPDYYERVKSLTQDEPHFHVMGYDGAGVVLGVGPDVKHFKQGDEVYYLGNPLGQGCYEEEMLVDERQYVSSFSVPVTRGDMSSPRGWRYRRFTGLFLVVRATNPRASTSSRPPPCR